MRIAVVLAAALLLVGCLGAPQSTPARLTPITGSKAADPATSTSAAPSDSASDPGSDSASAGSAVAAPEPGASVDDAIDWVEAAGPVDAADFAVAVRGGVSTPLGEDVAFTTPSGISCMTDLRRGSDELACLVDLTEPPPQPADVYGVWKGGWVDFNGTQVEVGSAHGDPGRFAAGQGMPLPGERSLSFGDFRCRADDQILVCVNYANRTAVRYSDSGIDAMGCSRDPGPTPGIGIRFTC